MHIALAGPFATADMAARWGLASGSLPQGYAGAPLLCDLADELLLRGHRLSLVTLTSDMSLSAPPLVHQHSAQLSITYCPMRPRAWPFNGWRLGRIVDLYAFERAQLARALRAAQPDVVHAHWAGEFAWAAQASGLASVLTCHDDPWSVARLQRRWRHRGYRWLRALMAGLVLRRALHLSAVSPHLAQVLTQTLAGRMRARFTVVPNPLAPQALAMQRQMQPGQPGQPGQLGRPRVLMVNHGFDALKNVATAMLAFEAFAAAHPQAELVLLGHDFAPGGAAQKWWGQRSTRVRFVGAVAHADVLAWMARSDVLVHAAVTEAFGMVVAEALALGLPVVAGAQSGAVPWVAGGSAWLVDVQDAQAITQALLQVMQQPLEAQRRASLGRVSMRERFGVAQVASAYEALYRQAMTQAKLR